MFQITCIINPEINPTATSGNAANIPPRPCTVHRSLYSIYEWVVCIWHFGFYDHATRSAWNIGHKGQPACCIIYSFFFPLDLLHSLRPLCGDPLLDLSLGQSLQFGASTNELSTEVDVGDSALTVE
jgi:hypothetical protein